MGWRVAISLLTLRDQVNAKWPNRSKDSDGTIGDAAHATRSSDHNPWVRDGAVGIVTAMDITNDPDNGPNSEAFAEALRASKDQRIKYIISNKKIASSSSVGGKAAWAWRPYSGSNPHNHHCHLSVKSDKEDYDSATSWDLSGLPHADDMPAPTPTYHRPLLKHGSSGMEVFILQSLLKIDKDSQFGDDTEAAVKAFQRRNGLLADGIVGPYTWEKLGGKNP